MALDGFSRVVALWANRIHIVVQRRAGSETRKLKVSVGSEGAGNRRRGATKGMRGQARGV